IEACPVLKNGALKPRWKMKTGKRNFLRRSLGVLIPVGALVFGSVGSSRAAADLCVPVGWATQNGGTTGGGTAAPVTVTTLADFQTQASSSGAKVILVQGTMGVDV